MKELKEIVVKIYSFDSDPKYKVFEVVAKTALMCKCGHRIEMMKEYDWIITIKLN